PAGYDGRVLRSGVVVLALLLAVSHARPAHAQFPPITSRDYAIDLYDGVALGNTDMVGMGGAGVAVVRGTAGALLNPSALAVRATTDSDRWGIDYHLDALTAQYSSDYDNNGLFASGGAQIVSGGLGLRIGNWAAGVTTLVQQTPAGDSMLTVRGLRVRYVLATWLPSLDLAVGGGIQTASFRLDPESGDSLFDVSGSGAILGATWLPREDSVRLGAGLEAPIDGGQVAASADCDPAVDCGGYILPDRVRVPWRVVTGIAYRFAPTEWNHQVETPFRDERALTLAADVVLTGATSNGYGVEAFALHELQPSGRSLALGVRGGAVYEAKPGRLRLRGGTYWEPGRFEGVGGRWHATFGADLRLLQFKLWGQRRGRISVMGDVASRYRNIVFDIGFWH
ncbi:MAG TPA: hypothetical protein VK607_05720, partial [Kofleriaceae bacterium]|nr:hypothetical protein [Kofleriaceae bacterium]